MVIQIKHNGKQYFIQSKPTRKKPSITPFRGKAMDFSDMNRCKNVRDDVLEYFDTAMIVR
jgi:hypothetical protein